MLNIYRFISKTSSALKLENTEAINILPLLTKLINQLLPQHCALCNCLLHADEELTLNSKVVCGICEITLPRIQTSCAKCNTPLSIESELCGVCIKQERHWEQCYAVFSYQEPISLLIHDFKYYNKRHLTKTLASLITERVADESEFMPDLLIPVPMHIKKLTKRGYNQSINLTKAISTQTNIPWKLIVVKSQHTRSQTKLESHTREHQLINSFKLNKHIQKDSFIGKHISIIDDVVTTGSTTSEIAKLLKKAGAKKVDVWCIART